MYHIAEYTKKQIALFKMETGTLLELRDPCETIKKENDQDLGKINEEKPNLVWEKEIKPHEKQQKSIQGCTKQNLITQGINYRFVREIHIKKDNAVEIIKLCRRCGSDFERSTKTYASPNITSEGILQFVTSSSDGVCWCCLIMS